MVDITIERIQADRSADLRLPNQPFRLCGRMVPRYDGHAWSHSVIWLPPGEQSEMTFPDEPYDFDRMAGEHLFVGAYCEGRCIGLAIYRHSWNKYLYLYDLKVCRDFRRCGVAGRLIEEGKALCREHGYLGIYTQGQDNNVAACLFYLHAGFVIGGLDTMVYRGTRQEGKSDILFYLTC